MAIKDYNTNEISFTGAVLREEEHMWADGMLSVTAVCWDNTEKKVVRKNVGYYGSDGCNLCQCSCEVDATEETWREVLRYLKPVANLAFSKSVADYKRDIRKGTRARVIRGKKVPIGTEVEVFWIGERPTYMSKQRPWLHETETIAGCYDENGNKLWIKKEYLKSIDSIKSPNAKERKKFVKAYVLQQAQFLGYPFYEL